jgi:FkbM family methyltransferase
MRRIRDQLHRWGPTSRLLSERSWRRRLRNDAALAACVSSCNPGDVAIDVGASEGIYALALRHRVGAAGRVIALEPNPVSFAALQRRTWRSGIAMYNYAASNEACRATLRVPRSKYGDHLHGLGSLAERATDAVDEFEVNAIPLDALDTGSGRIGLIKIDTEGWEYEVARGAQLLIAQHRPHLVVEIEERHLTPRGLTAADVMTYICSLGYRAEPIPDRAESSYSPNVIATSLPTDSGSSRQNPVNFLFTPIT